MPIELQMLVLAVVLLVAAIMVQASAGIVAVGAGPMAGNRDDLPPPTTFQARGKRVVENHIENLVVFAPLALVAVVSHHTSPWTAAAAQLFFWGRLAHAVIYFIGVPYVRTAAYMVSVAGVAIFILADLGVLS